MVAQGHLPPVQGSEVPPEALLRVAGRAGRAAESHGRQAARAGQVLRVLTSIVEEPVDVDGLLALLRLEDGAGLLLPHQGLWVHCRGRGAGHRGAEHVQVPESACKWPAAQLGALAVSGDVCPAEGLRGGWGRGPEHCQWPL